ncbi:MAG: DUF4157 domain-containing protein, partial [Desulfobulbaceae bacterium]|nr:DUF4157 domain-containing protein [Desulfobulbaceae bacterium]
MGQLRASVTATAEANLDENMFSKIGSPWINSKFSNTNAQSGKQLEATIQSSAPGAGGVNSARDYIPLVTNRVRSAIETWSSTNKSSDLPDELSANFPGGDDSNSLFNTGNLFFKTHNNNNPNPSTDPVQIQNQLKGSGHSLDSGTRSSMGSIFGQDFSNVRVHSDAKANNLSQ